MPARTGRSARSAGTSQHLRQVGCDSWSARAARSGDTAFERSSSFRFFHPPGACENGGVGGKGFSVLITAVLQLHGFRAGVLGPLHPKIRRCDSATKVPRPKVETGKTVGRRRRSPVGCRAMIAAFAVLFVRILARREDPGARNLFRFNVRVFGSVKNPHAARVVESRGGINSALLLRLRRAVSSRVCCSTMVSSHIRPVFATS